MYDVMMYCGKLTKIGEPLITSFQKVVQRGVLEFAPLCNDQQTCSNCNRLPAKASKFKGRYLLLRS